MIRTKLLIGLMCAGLAVLGCAKPSAPVVAAKPESSDKLKALEARVAKLETDLHDATTARDAAVGKWKVEQSRAVALEKERDAVRQVLAVRTAEKDSLQVQFDGFRKNLKELLGQTETATRPGTDSPANVLPNPAGL